MSPRDLSDLMDTPVLQTERLVLRAPRGADFETWAAFIGSPRSSFVGGPLGRGGAWRSFATLIGQWILRGYGTFVFCLRGEDAPLGQVGPWHPVEWPEREIAWHVWREGDEGKGYAAEATRAALAHVWRDLAWPSAVSYIDPANARSLGAGRAAGRPARRRRPASRRRPARLPPLPSGGRMTDRLTTERLTLRPPAPRDWEAYAAFIASDQARFFGASESRAAAWRSFGVTLWHWLDPRLRPLGGDRARRRRVHRPGRPLVPRGWPEHEIGWMRLRPRRGPRHRRRGRPCRPRRRLRPPRLEHRRQLHPPG